MTEDDLALIAAARAVVRPRRLSATVEVGTVGAALRGASGAVYTGVCIDAACGVGFCAEHGAVAAMITAGEARVMAMVAVDAAGVVLAPCGRCRELVVQVDQGNADTHVLVPGGSRLLRDLLPDHWLVGR